MKKSSRLEYLVKNTSIFAIGELGAKLISFFLVPFYTHILSTEQYGTVDLIFTICTVIVPLVMLNIGEAIMRYALDEDANYDKLFSISLVIIVIGCIVSLLIIPISLSINILANYAIYIYLYVILCATQSVLTSFLRGKEQLKLYVTCNLLNTFLIAIFNIIFLAKLHLGIKGYLTAYILAECISVFFAFMAGKMYCNIRGFTLDFQLAKKMIFFSLAVVPNSLLWWIMNSSDRVMVTAMCDVSENGILAVAYKLPSLLTMMNTILMQAWKYSAIKEKNSQDRDEFNNKMLKQFLKGSAIVAASMILFIKPFTKILFADAYYLSWEASTFLLLGFVFMGLGTFVGTIYYVEKNMIGNMLSALVGAIVNLVLNYLFIPKMGASGATLAACISYFVILMYRFFDTKKFQTLNLINIDNIITIGFLIIMMLMNFASGIIGSLVLIAIYIIFLIYNRKYLFLYITKIKNLLAKKQDMEEV